MSPPCPRTGRTHVNDLHNRDIDHPDVEEQHKRSTKRSQPRPAATAATATPPHPVSPPASPAPSTPEPELDPAGSTFALLRWSSPQPPLPRQPGTEVLHGNRREKVCGLSDAAFERKDRCIALYRALVDTLLHQPLWLWLWLWLWLVVQTVCRWRISVDKPSRACNSFGWQNAWESRLPASPPPLPRPHGGGQTLAVYLCARP